MKKHNVKIDEHDDFDGEENYCGSHYTFEGDGWNMDMSDVLEAVWDKTIG